MNFVYGQFKYLHTPFYGEFGYINLNTQISAQMERYTIRLEQSDGLF